MKQNSLIRTKFLGLLGYEQAAELMASLREDRLKSKVPDVLLCLEHPPVITMGRRPSMDDLKFPAEEIKKKGIALTETDRGGKLTYHGPGQLVVYFIFDIEARGLSVEKFVWMAEEGLSLLLAEQGIQAARDPLNPGLWIGQKKIASLGFHIRKGISTHGIALNVTNDLKPFDLFIPCGIQNTGVTSIFEETGKKIPTLDSARRLVELYSEVFGSEVQWETSL